MPELHRSFEALHVEDTAPRSHMTVIPRGFHYQGVNTMRSIEQYYNYDYNEWERLERHRIEFEITKRALNKFIPDGASVLDVGGGPGRYSIYLAQKGHGVTLVDLCEKMVEQAIEHSKEAGVELKACIQGNVLDLHKILPGKEYDAILCMGPIYHLLEENQREEAINQCMGLLKKGGILVVSFISTYAPIVDCLRAYPQDIGRLKDEFFTYFEDGRHDSRVKEGFTDAYFFNPEQIEEFMSRFKLETLKIMAVEGLGAIAEEKLMQLKEEDFQHWLDVLEAISLNPVVWGSSEHMLYIGRKEG